MWIETNSGWFQSPNSQREAKTKFTFPNYHLRLARRQWRHGLGPFHVMGERSWNKTQGQSLGYHGGKGPLILFCCCCSVTMSNSLQPHGLQYARLSCPSPSSRVCSNLCPLSRWRYLTISSSATLLSFFLQSFPASGSFAMSQLFSSGDQSIGASGSVLPVNIQSWFLLGLTCWISLQSKGHSRVFSSTTVQKHRFFSAQPFLWSKSHIHPYLTIGKTIPLTMQIFVGKVMSLLFNMLSRLVITFLPRSKCLLISWLQSPSALFLEPKKIKSLILWHRESSVSPCSSCQRRMNSQEELFLWNLADKLWLG